MNNLRKISALLLAVILLLALSAAVFAAGDTPPLGASPENTEEGDPTDAPTDAPTDTPTQKPEETTTSVKIPEGYSIQFFLYDGEGNEIRSGSVLSCLGSGSSLYIKHDYQIRAFYYNSSAEADKQKKEPEQNLILGVDGPEEYISVGGDNLVVLKASPKAYTFTIRYADPSNEKGENSASASVQRFTFSLLDIIIAAIGIYVIVNAIRGKGSMFSDEFIAEEKKDKFKKLTRIFALLAGAAFIASAALTICFSYLDWVKIARYVCLGFGLAGVIGVIVVGSRLTDKEKRDKARATAQTGGGNASSAAFEFDGTEPTIDDVLAEIEKNKDGKEE